MTDYCKECSYERDHFIHDISKTPNRYHSSVLEHPFSEESDPRFYLTSHKRTLLLAQRINLLQRRDDIEAT